MNNTSIRLLESAERTIAELKLMHVNASLRSNSDQQDMILDVMYDLREYAAVNGISL